MGACCCCPKKRTRGRRTSEESVPLSFQPASATAGSAGTLVDTNLDTSIPDTYRPPPPPLPFDVVYRHPQNPPPAQETDRTMKDAGAQTTESDSIPEAFGTVTEFSSRGDLNEIDSTVKINCGVDSRKDTEAEPSQLVKPIVLSIVEVEEDVCPICLEEYDAENPKTLTKCEHHYHLACILEWMERSKACPVCDQEMIFDPPIN